ncbi:hypothetical protein B296_00036845 [Ensete ventricosum]|uniref:Uncharacterized protein n=1 Tax=Ensete ventricosum TaxID=4639 RepID=A0A426ZX02_ENSVE|nr:hypothetical protein B296_00036845 [Ensete ventricosum]
MVDFDRQRPILSDINRGRKKKREKKKREKKRENLKFGVALPIPIRRLRAISSPARSVACERFLLPVQGEETSPRLRRRNEATLLR